MCHEGFFLASDREKKENRLGRDWQGEKNQLGRIENWNFANYEKITQKNHKEVAN